MGVAAAFGVGKVTGEDGTAAAVEGVASASVGKGTAGIGTVLRGGAVVRHTS